LANQKKHNHGFKTRPHIDMMKADFSIIWNIWGISGYKWDDVKYYGHNSPREFQKPEIFGFKLCGLSWYHLNFKDWCGK
jgi:hypothetical protein